MELHWQLLHRSSLEDALWVMQRDATMWILWDWLWIVHLGIPWHGSMGNAVGFHGLALGLLIGQYKVSALWVGHWDVHMGVPWDCIGNAP